MPAGVGGRTGREPCAIATTAAIGSYGLLGDTRTAALVDETGSIDWLCLPHFDGDPVFGRLVAGAGGGRFRLGPLDGAVVVGRGYRPGSAVLETAWECGGARLILVEGMVADVRGRLLPTSCLVRRLHAHGGAVNAELCVDPRFGPGRGPPKVTRQGSGLLVCSAGSTALSVAVDRDVPVPPGRSVQLEVSPDRPLTVVLTAAS